MQDEKNLFLVSTEDLLDEITRRFDYAIFASGFQRTSENCIGAFHVKGNLHTLLGLVMHCESVVKTKIREQTRNKEEEEEEEEEEEGQ